MSRSPMKSKTALSRLSALSRLTAGACAALVAVGTVAPLSAVAQSYPAGARSTVPVGSGPQLVNLPRGTSFAVDLPADAHDVIISNPAVAEAMLHSPRRITVIGIAPGTTDAVFLDASGRAILSLSIRVDAGVSALQDTISRIAPGSQARAEAVNDSIILTGLVTSPGEADRIAQVARAFVSGPEKVLNMLTVAGSDQVTLKVRVVEVQRTALKQLGLSSDVVFNTGSQSVSFGRANTYGVNGSAMGGGGVCFNQNRARTTNFSNSNSTNSQNTTGTTQTGTSGTSNLTVTQTGLLGEPGRFATETVQNSNTLTNTVGNTLTNAISSAASTLFSTVTGNDASACLVAFESVGLLRTLAEPNLTSVNGESASFLAGGEFPVPVGRDSDGQITIEYKPYGVSLAFRPVIQSGGNISLQVNVEVSDLSANGALTIGAGTVSSITLPGLNVRRSQTTVELPSGGSMMIAGMLQETTRQAIDSLPGATALPVLGSLFRSRDYLNGETELVVIVEPYIVSPTSPGRMQTPADGLRIATDLQATLFGQLNQTYGTPAPTAMDGTGWVGPVGYVIE